MQTKKLLTILLTLSFSTALFSSNTIPQESPKEKSKVQKVEIHDSILSSSSNIELKRRIINEKAIKFDLANQESKTLNIEFESDDFAQSYKKLKKLIKKTKAIILHSKQNQSSRNKRINISLSVNKKDFEYIQNNMTSLGYLKYQNLSTNNNHKNKLHEMELKHLLNKALIYETEFKKMDSSNPNYLTFLNTIQETNDKIFTLQKQIAKNSKVTKSYKIHIKIHEQHSEPLNESFSFVNMPGVEYNYLLIDSPKKGLSSEAYHGWGIKYMFSRGKSYILLNIIKTFDSIKDPNQMQEMFIYAYGADFYPKYLGAGKRLFLNLYSGFTIGGIYMSSDNSNRHAFQITAHLGLELLKTKRLLIDTKAGYFLPFTENRNLRGYLFTGSVNFMF